MCLTFLNSSNSKHALGIDKGSFYLKSSPHTKDKHGKTKNIHNKIITLDKKNKLRTKAHPSVTSDFLFSSFPQKGKYLASILCHVLSCSWKFASIYWIIFYLLVRCKSPHTIHYSTDCLKRCFILALPVLLQCWMQFM